MQIKFRREEIVHGNQINESQELKYMQYKRCEELIDT